MPSRELTALIHMLTSRPMPEQATVADRRQGFDMLAAKFPLAPDVRCDAVDANGVAAAWVVAPGADTGRTLLYLHGGGYVIGSINTHRDLAARLSRAAAARVLLIDYRLAPEHPHPAAVDDAVTAYRWLLQQGAAPTSTVIAGDSAGGGLTVAALVALRAAGAPLPAAGVCISPWVDLEGIGDSMSSKASVDPIVQLPGLQWFAGLYLNGAHPRTPLAAPLYADLHGLPPLLIHVGTAETLLDDATRLAARAQAAGVEVTLDAWEGMIHVWHLFAAMLPEGQQAIERVGAYIRQHAAA
ncbi:MAG: alpha/beta hydrolase [Candidatus Tectomicrobia bacterium]|uniref:Alpha/beta hydrolase n=1 Tax=Tectimicrobiota bacterium TaxID=2528274 RepID=A0A937VZT4_UNCTE|nr:alpha/beta hydrolase [Candidatus Tectomicrobia bacterium]